MINVCFVGSRWRGGDSFNYVFVSILIGEGSKLFAYPEIGGIWLGREGEMCSLQFYYILNIILTFIFNSKFVILTCMVQYFVCIQF
jgi:hypothetical protein